MVNFQAEGRPPGLPSRQKGAYKKRGRERPPVEGSRHTRGGSAVEGDLSPPPPGREAAGTPLGPAGPRHAWRSRPRFPRDDIPTWLVRGACTWGVDGLPAGLSPEARGREGCRVPAVPAECRAQGHTLLAAGPGASSPAPAFTRWREEGGESEFHHRRRLRSSLIKTPGSRSLARVAFHSGSWEGGRHLIAAVAGARRGVPRRLRANSSFVFLGVAGTARGDHGRAVRKLQSSGDPRHFEHLLQKRLP